MRLVFEPRTEGRRDEFANVLLAQTSMESSAPVNLVMIGRDGRPRQKTLTDILLEWIDFRVETVRRRSQHRLTKVEDRIHILEGRQQILLNIDKVIKLIRNSDEPKPELMKAFQLSDRQAEDILEIRLRQLARLEGIKIEQELKQLREDQAGLAKLLGSDAVLRKQVGKEFDEDAKKYGDARRTKIEEASRAAVEVKLLDEPVTVILSAMGFVRARSGHGHDASQFSFKQGDSLYGAYEVRTVDNLLAFGSNGRVYTVPVASLPSARGDGAPLTSMIELEAGSKLVGFIAAPAEQALLLATTNGYGFTCKFGDMLSRQRGGKQFVNVEEGAQPLRPQPLEPARETRVACVSEKGRLLVFDLDEVKQQSGGGRGVTLMGLDDGEKLLAAVPTDKGGFTVQGLTKAGKPAEIAVDKDMLKSHAGTRARKGTLIKAGFKPVDILRPPRRGPE